LLQTSWFLAMQVTAYNGQHPSSRWNRC